MKRKRGASAGSAEAVEQAKRKRTRLSHPEAKREAKQPGSTGQGQNHTVHSSFLFFFPLPFPTDVHFLQMRATVRTTWN